MDDAAGLPFTNSKHGDHLTDHLLCSRHCAEHSAQGLSLNSCEKLYESVTNMIRSLQLWELRLKGFK